MIFCTSPIEVLNVQEEITVMIRKELALSRCSSVDEELSGRDNIKRRYPYLM
jgi:hypothetical protein